MNYLSCKIHELPKIIGTDENGARRTVIGEEGYVAHGPYCRLEPGDYFGGFYIKVSGALINGVVAKIDFCANDGKDMLVERMIQGKELVVNLAVLQGVQFTISSTAERCEVRLFATGYSNLEVESMVIFRTDLI